MASSIPSKMNSLYLTQSICIHVFKWHLRLRKNREGKVTLKKIQWEPIIIKVEEGSVGEVHSKNLKRSQVIKKIKKVRQVQEEVSKEEEVDWRVEI